MWDSCRFCGLSVRAKRDCSKRIQRIVDAGNDFRFHQSTQQHGVGQKFVCHMQIQCKTECSAFDNRSYFSRMAVASSGYLKTTTETPFFSKKAFNFRSVDKTTLGRRSISRCDRLRFFECIFFFKSWNCFSQPFCLHKSAKESRLRSSTLPNSGTSLFTES